jgi:hypothetical protein
VVREVRSRGPLLVPRDARELVDLLEASVARTRSRSSGSSGGSGLAGATRQPTGSRKNAHHTPPRETCDRLRGERSHGLRGSAATGGLLEADARCEACPGGVG